MEAKNPNTKNIIVFFILLLFTFSIIDFFTFFYRDVLFLILNIICQLLLSTFFLSISRKLFIGYLILFGIIATIYFPVLRTYGDIDYNLIISLTQTDVNESFSYLKVLEVKLVLYILVFWLLIIASIYFSKYIKSSKKINIISIISVPIIIVVIQLNQWNIGKANSFLHKDFINNDIVASGSILPSFTFIYKVISKKYEVEKFLAEYESMKDAYNYTWKIKPKTDIPLHNVIIIGESESKYMRNIFNEKYPDNFLNTSKNIEFNHYYSASSITINSLTHTLIYSNQKKQHKNLNIAALLKTLNIQSYWLSNQGKIGRHDSPISAIALGFDTCIFTKPNDVISNNTTDDTLLVPFYSIIKQSKNNNTPSCIVLHLVGSHPPFNVAQYQQPIDNYIATISNTDNLIKNIFEILSEQGNNFNLFYFSDHGLSQMENGNFIHGSDYLENYHVPFAIWSSKINHKQYINAPRSAFDFLNIFLEQNNIDYTQESINNYNFSLISNEILPNKIQILNKFNQPILLETLNSSLNVP